MSQGMQAASKARKVTEMDPPPEPPEGMTPRF